MDYLYYLAVILSYFALIVTFPEVHNRVIRYRMAKQIGLTCKELYKVADSLQEGLTREKLDKVANLLKKGLTREELGKVSDLLQEKNEGLTLEELDKVSDLLQEKNIFRERKGLTGEKLNKVAALLQIQFLKIKLKQIKAALQPFSLHRCRDPNILPQSLNGITESVNKAFLKILSSPIVNVEDMILVLGLEFNEEEFLQDFKEKYISNFEQMKFLLILWYTTARDLNSGFIRSASESNHLHQD